MLGRTLDIYSGKALAALLPRFFVALGSINMDDETAAAFCGYTRQEINGKHFLHESDRKVALGIIEGFRVRRVLLDAICRKDLDAMDLDAIRGCLEHLKM